MNKNLKKIEFHFFQKTERGSVYINKQAITKIFIKKK
jgi:hypothetical protein